VKSGTPAEFFIQTGSRSMLSYITKPLRDQIARSFRSD
jgi:HlyD family secretion protein